MLSRKKFYKLYESLTSLTDIYGDLVEIAKTFEKELGAEDIATTGLFEAVAKVNELILRYNPSADELGEEQTQEKDQSLQDLQDFDDSPIQGAQLQNDNAQGDFAQGQGQGQGTQQTQEDLDNQAQSQL